MDKKEEVSLAIQNATNYEELVSILNINELENIPFDDIVNKLSIFCNTFDEVDDALVQASKVIGFYTKIDEDKHSRFNGFFDGYSVKNFIYRHVRPLLNKLADLGKPIVEQMISLDEVNDFMKKYDSYDRISNMILLEWGDTYKSLIQKWDDLARPVVEQMTSLDEIGELIKKYINCVENLHDPKEPRYSSEIIMQRWNKIALAEIEKMDEKQLGQFLDKYNSELYTTRLDIRATSVADKKWTKLVRGYDSIFDDDMYIGYWTEDPRIIWQRQVHEHAERLSSKKKQ